MVQRPGAAGGTGLIVVNPVGPSGGTLCPPADLTFITIEGASMFKRILFPTDGSDITAKALTTAVEMARLHGAELSVLAVKEPFPYSAISEMQPVPPQEFYDAQERIAEARVKEVTKLAGDAGITSHGFTVEAMHPWEAILEHAATQGCDLIIMASHGRRGVSALLLGSETQKVLTHSTLPVLVVR
jgi:nucleotide-binding universal stress UspA family protein